MRSMTGTLSATLATLLGCAVCVHGELTSGREALVIARNYVRFVVANEGNWGGSQTAEVASVEELTRGGRTLGYFCHVRPRGFLVLSLHKELAPVRAYSSRCDLDPEAEEGLADLIKDRMEGTLRAVERRLGRPLEPDDRIDALLEINYRAVSDTLASATFDPQQYRAPRRVRTGGGMDYQEGEVMLNSNWHQQPPYNDQCPGMGCDWSGYGHFNYCARAGCVAIAGAQVMYYWRWPPAGAGPEPFDDEYDWLNMCTNYIYDGAGWFYNEHEESVTWDQIYAVANLCSEVGLAVGMDYACDGSSAPTAYLEDAFEDYFRYDENGCVVYRSDYDDPVAWFSELRNQFNANRPVPYRVEGHAIVGDGWRVDRIERDYYWYHMNYGWGGGIPDDPDWPGYPSSNAWFALDELYLGTEDEYIIAIVVPNVAIGAALGPRYLGGLGYRRYFDRDAAGTNSTFYAGQGLQILKSGFLLVNSGDPSAAIRFYGDPSPYTTRFFLDADPVGKTRIRIQGGGMKISGGGGMVIR